MSEKFRRHDSAWHNVMYPVGSQHTMTGKNDLSSSPGCAGFSGYDCWLRKSRVCSLLTPIQFHKNVPSCQRQGPHSLWWACLLGSGFPRPEPNACSLFCSGLCVTGCLVHSTAPSVLHGEGTRSFACGMGRVPHASCVGRPQGHGDQHFPLELILLCLFSV